MKEKMNKNNIDAKTRCYRNLLPWKEEQLSTWSYSTCPGCRWILIWILLLAD